MNKKTLKRLVAAAAAGICLAGIFAACSKKQEAGAAASDKETNAPADNAPSEAEADTSADQTEIQVFIAASLNTVMTDLAERYQKDHPQVKIIYNADSSGTLLTQIQEGYECDIFFSAAKKQMDTLESDGLMVEGSRHDVVNNQVVVLTLKDSGTSVKGLETLKDAKNIALAGGSVPVGKYTRQALVNLGILAQAEDVSLITTQEVSEALGGVEISEQDNVSKVLAAVTEGACEVGTTYYSDTYGYEDQVEILEKVDYSLTGDVIYPICLVQNKEADDAQAKAAEEFLNYVISDEAKEIFGSYYFDTDL